MGTIYSTNDEVKTQPIAELVEDHQISAEEVEAVDALLEVVRRHAPELKDQARMDAKVLASMRAAEVQANKTILMRALAAVGAERAVVSYEGDGDSGGVESVSITPISALQAAESRKVVLVSVDFEWYRGRDTHVVVRQHSLLNGLSSFVDGALLGHLGHSGYENNEGGYGEVTFTVDLTKKGGGTIDVAHSDRVVETVDTTHTL